MMAICLVEDDDAVAASLDALLTQHGFSCSRFASGDTFLAAAPRDPLCILLDVRLPGTNGIEVLRQFRRVDGQTPVIVITGHGDVDMAVAAMRGGAQDFIEKPFDGDDLVGRVRTAIERALPDMECRSRLDTLTPRETEVLREIVAGHPNKVIAYNLGISQKTVELHRGRVMDKTGAKNVQHLMRIALHGGMEIGDPV